jgi:ribosomal-protein-serine acetyltransferase
VALVFSARLTDEVDLRSWDPVMAAPMVRALNENRSHIRGWLSWPHDGYGLDDARWFIERQLEVWARDGLMSVGIWRGEDLIGGVTPNSSRPGNKSVALGYWIAASEQGKGLVTRACRAVIDDLFAARSMHRIVINVHPENVRSRRVPERLGFREEGTLREAVCDDHGFHDWVVYAMLEDEWRARP